MNTVSLTEKEWNDFLREKKQNIYLNFLTNDIKHIYSIFENSNPDTNANIDVDDVNIDTNENIDTNANIDVDDVNKYKTNELFISTKTKSAYLNTKIDINQIFWKLELEEKNSNKNGIIKKQIKLDIYKKEELDTLFEKCKSIENQGYIIENHTIKEFINPDGRIKFKSIRRITVGASEKIIKKKISTGAFHHCIVLLLRYKCDHNNIKEYHVKLFNTGKVEVLGIQNDDTIFDALLSLLIDLVSPFIEDNVKLEFKMSNEMVIINSTFYCGFKINREIFYSILKNKYHLEVIYDSCSYPGVICRYYYNTLLEKNKQTGILPILEENKNKKKNPELPENIFKISFMIFRTGKINIVGKCDEQILGDCYSYLIHLLDVEKKEICLEISNLFD